MAKVEDEQTIVYMLPDSDAGPLHFRPFGSDGQDALLSLETANRPQVITDVLMHCNLDPSREEASFWALPLNQRVKLLLLISYSDQPVITMVQHCSQCNELMEFPFTLDELTGIIDAHNQPSVDVHVGGQLLKLERPCGHHQKTWQEMNFKTEQAATIGIIQSLVSNEVAQSFWDDHLDDELVSTIDRIMGDFDPITAFSFSTTCPECQRAHQVMIDWERECLSRLQKKQRQLLYSVHQLARHYSWPEEDILALPSWRRQHYMDLIQNSKG